MAKRTKTPDETDEQLARIGEKLKRDNRRRRQTRAKIKGSTEALIAAQETEIALLQETNTRLRRFLSALYKMLPLEWRAQFDKLRVEFNQGVIKDD